MSLRRVISGGQVGADRAGLLAAERVGLRTGGWAPLGWKTKTGPCPELGTRFGLVEATTPDYPERTALNVLESDATLRVAYDFRSRGEVATAKAIMRHDRPWLDVEVPRPPFEMDPSFYPLAVRDVQRWLRDSAVETLNVAGNANPALEPWATRFLVDVFLPFRPALQKPIRLDRVRDTI